MNIAICDDEIRTTQSLESLIDAVLGSTAYEYSYKSFHSGDSLLVYLDTVSSRRRFQIYLLDIEMAGTNGLKTAAQIRRHDSDAVIVFITSHGELMPEAFQVLAFDYIIKPFEDERVKKVLGSAVRLLENRRKLYLYKKQKTTHTVYYSQIEYIESMGRKIVLHLTDGEKIEYNGTLKEAAAKTEGLTFAQTHNSFVVNIEGIAKLESHQLWTRTGEIIPISSKFHASFHASYRNYILMKV